jgi:hypothetical protein
LQQKYKGFFEFLQVNLNWITGLVPNLKHKAHLVEMWAL